MELSQYLVVQLEDTVARHHSQVLGIVPFERQKERMPGGNSIAWATYHVGRHAALALEVLGHPSTASTVMGPGSGLQEVEQDWFVEVTADEAAAYTTSVFADVREYFASSPDLDARVDVTGGLRSAGIDETTFGWLYRMWDQPVSFLVAWPLTGHITSHVGEMIATRNQLGLSPFR